MLLEGKIIFSKIVYFRVDGNLEIGLGHIFRCITLAKYFKKYNIESVFIVRHLHKDILDDLASFRVIKIKEELELIKHVSDSTRSVVIFDISHKYIMSELHYIKSLVDLLNKNSIKSVMFDGLTKEDSIQQNINTLVSCLIVPYLNVHEKDFYRSKQTLFLSGLKYFIFREKFYEVSKYKDRYVKKRGLLISLGGSDPENLTPEILNFLSQLNYVITVVIGKNFSKKNISYIKLLSGKKKIKVIYNPSNIYKLISNSKLLITSTGLTKYEALALNTPSIIISKNDDMKELHKNLKDFGIIYYGKIRYKKLFVNCLSKEFMKNIKNKLPSPNGMKELCKLVINEEYIYEK